jgi:ATP/maltotriose-dependent transcriptional regulator MalT
LDGLEKWLKTLNFPAGIVQLVERLICNKLAEKSNNNQLEVLENQGLFLLFSENTPTDY